VSIGGNGLTLMESRSGSIGLDIKSHGKVGITITRFDHVVVVVSGHVPVTTHDIVLMLAVSLSDRTVEADSEAELSGAHETGPFVSLGEGTGGVGEDDSTFRVSVSISTMGIQLSSRITSRDSDFSEITDSSKLDVKACLDEVSSGDGSRGQETGPISRLGAPSNLDPLGDGDGSVGTIRVGR